MRYSYLIFLRNSGLFRICCQATYAYAILSDAFNSKVIHNNTENGQVFLQFLAGNQNQSNQEFSIKLHVSKLFN